MRFKNISQIDQFGVEPGQSGEADLSKEEAERAVARNAIEVDGEGAPAVTPEETKTPEEVEAEEAAAAEAKKAEEDAAGGGGPGGRRGR